MRRPLIALCLALLLAAAYVLSDPSSPTEEPVAPVPTGPTLEEARSQLELESRGNAPSTPPSPADAELAVAEDGTRISVPAEPRSGWIVTLRDPSGAPVPDQRVVLRVVTHHMGGLTRTLSEAGPTDRDGVCFVPDPHATLDETLRRLLGEAAQDAPPTFVLEPAGLLGFEPMEHLGDGESVPSGTTAPAGDGGSRVVVVTPGAATPPVHVQLTRPDCGVVRVRVRSTGEPLSEGLQLHLNQGWASYLSGTARVLELPAGQTEVVVPLDSVGLDQRFEAEVRAPGNMPLARIALDGPTAEQLTVEVTLELPPGGPRLRGRALGLDGAPLTAVLVQAPTRSSTLSPRRFVPLGVIPTDEQGVFDVPATWSTGPHTGHAILRLVAGDDDSRAHERVLRTGPEVHLHDLGPCPLGPLPLVVSGRVLEPGGAPVRSGVRLTFHNAAAEDGSWERYVVDLETDELGAFEHRAALPEGRLQLELLSETHVLVGGPGTLVDALPGTSDLRVVAHGLGWLSADVSSLPAAHRSHFTLRTRLRDADPEAERLSRQSMGLHEPERLGPVIAGDLRVELSLWGVGTVAAWDLVLPSGSTHDLGHLTPDRPLYPHDVLLEGPGVDAETSQRVSGRSANGQHRGLVAHGERHVSFLTDEPLLQVVLEVPGEDDRVFEVVGPRTRIRLE